MVLGRGIARNVAQGNTMIQAAVRAGNPTALAYMAHRGHGPRTPAIGCVEC